MRTVIVFIAIVQIFTQTKAQNEDQRDVEWSENDPRWETRIPNWWEEENFVPPVGPIEERAGEFWTEFGQNVLEKKISQKQNLNKAKNLILFIGDGMGLSTLMATRSYIDDVQTELSFEKFPYSGLSKPYCINYQVPDSACTGTALMTGVKSNYGTIAVNGNVNLRNCTAQLDNSTHLHSLLKYAQDAGKSTGIITTTRITHATPASTYAKTASRYWESNENTPSECEDIAHQLIHGEIGSRLDVIMGGGRRHFLPDTQSGYRTDNRSLINEYLQMQQDNSKIARYVENRTDLLAIDETSTDKILGIFAHSHLEYKFLADSIDQPTLVEMTTKALQILKKNEHGFVLVVEGGRIDTAHHDTLARLALDESVEFHKTVDFVRTNTDEDNTLIVVTSDHSTVMTVGGYMPRGYNILGPGDYSRNDRMWFYTLSYANGPGHSDHFQATGGRVNPQGQRYFDPYFRRPATVPEEEETHAGEDVGVYASGPYAHVRNVLRFS
ncbi:hypothetical protein HA402_000398 [Bradysia odoriphaga]|nr:hypothetical protein HA402_000398 [Bradysia odoriphaga]